MSTDNPMVEDFASKTCHGRWLKFQHEPGLVSVIIMTFNRADVLGETLDSVFAQTYRPIELIVVDDGSTDGTRTLVEAWSKKRFDEGEFRIRYLRQKHFGAPAARNLGLVECRGEYIQFLGSDDLLGTEKLEKQMIAVSKKPDVVPCGPWMFFWEEKGRFVKKAGKHIDFTQDIIAQWLAGKYFIEIAFLWPRKVIYRIGPWDESLVREQDGDYFVRAVLLDIRFSYVPGAFSYWRQLPCERLSITNTPSVDSIKSRIRVIQKLESALRRRGDFFEYRCHLAGWFNMAAMAYVGTAPEIADWCFKKCMALSPEKRERSRLPVRLAKRFLRKRTGESFYDLKLHFTAKRCWKTAVSELQNGETGRALISFFTLFFNHPIWSIINVPRMLVKRQRAKNRHCA